jgi:type I restriction enzyme S subunit
LEIAIVGFKELSKVIDYRIEAEYFAHKFLEIDNSISNIQTVSFTDIATFVNGRPYNSNCFNCIDGVSISKIGDVTNKREISDWEYVTVDEFKEQKGKLLADGDILMTLTGDPPDVGKVNYIHNPVNASWNQRVAKIRIKAKQTQYHSNEVLFAVLSTEFARTQLERYAKGIRQRNLGNESLDRLRIPVLSIGVQSIIENYIHSSYQSLSKSHSLYNEAEDILLSEIGLKSWQPNNNPINIKQLKESFLASGRLDAEYYQPKYDDYNSLIKAYNNGFDLLGSVCVLNEKNYIPSEKTEYRYIELSNIGKSGDITGCTTAIGAELPSRARRLVHTNDVIISSIEGSLQSVALVTEDYNNSICSTGFYVIKSDVINPETLLVLFKSEPMQNLLKQGCSGTILTAIGRNELQNIAIPKIRKAVQSEIAEYVQKSIALRNEAKQLLENAKLQVENEISWGGVIDNQSVTKFEEIMKESTYYYRLAEWTLLQELYSEKWGATSTANYSVKNFSVCQMAGRLDAEYYQPKYDALFSVLSNFECDTISNIATIKKSVEPGSDAYKESGIPFVRVSDVSKFEISEPNVFLSPNEYDLKELQPKKDTILLSKDGSVGIAYKVDKDMNCITSGALLHLSVFNKDYNPDYLTLVLNSIVVQMQAERDSNGAIIQHWKPSEIEQVIVPKLPKPIQESISAKIQESFALKAESKRLLEEAKMMVEIGIEKGI